MRVKPKFWKNLLTGSTALALVFAAGCANSDSGDNGSADTNPDNSGSNTDAQDESFTIGIVEQQLANPFFAKLQEAAVAEAESLGLKTITAESLTAGDSATQIQAIENMISEGVKGIVLDPASASALVDVVRQAEDAGIMVITVNTSLDPADTATAGYETDNFVGGTLMGEWAMATLGDRDAQVAMLDYDLSDATAKARHDGFLEGAGLTDQSPEIVGTALTQSNVETGQQEMENLIAAHPDINVLYTINEPAALGAHLALVDAGKDNDVIITSIDGSCDGVQLVQDGTIGATVMQFPTEMGRLAVEAIHKFVTTGEKVSGINNSGTTLITDNPIEGIDSETSEWGLENCWG